ncbi:PH domain-containing protein [Micromonospora noduli]|uniref:PH domain-containing protein n=1 Tax=Micromonospora noduli TaxID=709876 RepID=UPI000DBFEFD1|nr:PH domain-containing protein [Micromonospora noduli]RAO06709.1 hypothetical protein GUI43_04620 [Micromonospora noduli]
MRTAWRSWFWNITLLIVMLVMAIIVTGVAISEKNMVAAAGFGVGGLLCWIGAFRAPTLGVYAKPQGVVVREFTRTRTVGWGEILGIEMAGGEGSASLSGPVIRRRGKGGKETVVELNALGGYGLFRPNDSPGRQAVAGLNEHLKTWRSSQDPRSV